MSNLDDKYQQMLLKRQQRLNQQSNNLNSNRVPDEQTIQKSKEEILTQYPQQNSEFKIQNIPLKSEDQMNLKLTFAQQRAYQFDSMKKIQNTYLSSFRDNTAGSPNKLGVRSITAAQIQSLDSNSIQQLRQHIIPQLKLQYIQVNEQQEAINQNTTNLQVQSNNHFQSAVSVQEVEVISESQNQNNQLNQNQQNQIEEEEIRVSTDTEYRDDVENTEEVEEVNYQHVQQVDNQLEDELVEVEVDDEVQNNQSQNYENAEKMIEQKVSPIQNEYMFSTTTQQPQQQQTINFIPELKNNQNLKYSNQNSVPSFLQQQQNQTQQKKSRFSINLTDNTKQSIQNQIEEDFLFQQQSIKVDDQFINKFQKSFKNQYNNIAIKTENVQNSPIQAMQNIAPAQNVSNDNIIEEQSNKTQLLFSPAKFIERQKQLQKEKQEFDNQKCLLQKQSIQKMNQENITYFSTQQLDQFIQQQLKNVQ